MMTDDAAKKYVEVLLDYQYDLLFNKQYGVNHAEFLFAETARELVQYPQVRAWFFGLAENCMIEGLPDQGAVAVRPASFVPDEFLFYLAHRTRWPEFFSIAERMRDRPEDLWLTNRSSRWSDLIGSALRDDWIDRDFYEEFDGPPRV